MNRFGVALSALLCFTEILPAQPMSGNYTVGGTSPSFVTLQDAANALKSRGISGPVFINIRPGTYIRDGGATRVMVLDSAIGGVSSVNRITFQPDVAAGGNPSNVILQGDFNVNTPNGQQEIVLLGTDYTTIRNLTFKDADSLDTPAWFLIHLMPDFFWNTTIEGVVVEGCTFIGTPYYPRGFGTDFGVYASGGLITARISGNRFMNLRRAASFDIDSAPSGDSLVAEDNRFEHLYGGFTGSGNPLGAAIEMVCAHPSVRRNFVTQSSGSVAIDVVYPVSGTIEGNYVQGSFGNGQIRARSHSSIADRTDSLMVLNNITMGTGAMEIRTGHTRLFHNTIIHYGSFGSTGLYVSGAQCTVLNNILLVYGGGIMYEQLGSAGLASDHNVFFATSVYIARDGGGQYYFSFDSYRSGSGLDTNSHFTDVSFISDSLGIHLEECEAQNRDLDGIPLAEVRVDYYGARRDSVKPFIGAVEGVRLPYNMFAAPFKAGLPGMAFSIAAGRFDNSTTPGIAVSDYDNRQVFLFHNTGAGRTFSHTGTVFTGFRPVEVRFADFDGDNNLDLIVGGDTNSIGVFWGNGSGGFSSPTMVGTFGRVRSLEPVYFNGQHANTIWITEDNGFLPNAGFLGNLVNLGNRQLCHDITYRVQGISYVHDTIPSVMTALAVGDFDSTTSGNEIATLAFDFVPRFMITRPDEILFGTPCSSAGRLGFFNSHSQYAFPTASFLGFGSNIAVGDFDGDGDKDFITTGASENECVFLRNQGNATFVVDTISTTATRGVAALDYENDGDLDFVTINRTLDSLGVTIFLNDGAGHFTEKRNCHYPFASGWPNGIVAVDFDLDGRKDIAIVSRTIGGHDSLFVLYNLGGLNATTGVADHPKSELPQGFSLLQNYPNPFNPSTRIEYTLSVESGVAIKVYNILGQEVATLVNEQQSGGRHVVEWNGRSTNGLAVSSGVYFYRIEARQLDGQFQYASVKKMVLMK